MKGLTDEEFRVLRCAVGSAEVFMPSHEAFLPVAGALADRGLVTVSAPYVAADGLDTYDVDPTPTGLLALRCEIAVRAGVPR